MTDDSEKIKNKAFSALLMFIIGFVGFSVAGVVVLILLIAFGLLPSI